MVDLTAEVRYLSEQKKFSVGVRAQPQPAKRLDRAGAFPLSPRPSPRRARSTATGTSPSSTARPSTDRSRSPPRATAISCPTGGGTSTSPACRPIGSVDRPRVDPGPARTAAESRGRAESHRPDQPPRQLRPRADGPAGRAAPLALGRAAGLAAVEPPAAAASSSRTSTARSSLLGGFDGQRLQSRGELAIDSLNYKDCQLTQVTGPIWIDDGRVLFGSWVDRRENAARRADAHRPAPAAAADHGQPLRRHASTPTAG